MWRFLAKYLHILCQICPDTLPFISTYLGKYLYMVAFPLYALLLPVSKSRISDLRSKILTLGKNKLKRALFVFPLA